MEPLERGSHVIEFLSRFLRRQPKPGRHRKGWQKKRRASPWAGYHRHTGRKHWRRWQKRQARKARHMRAVA